MLASLRAYEEQSPRRSAFLRSLSIVCGFLMSRSAHSLIPPFQSTFFNGSKILLAHEPPWMIDRFFWEIAAIEPGTLSRLADHSSSENGCEPSSSRDSLEVTEQASGLASSDRVVEYQDKEMVALLEKGLAKVWTSSNSGPSNG